MIAGFIAGVAASPLAPWIDAAPWAITGQSIAIVERLLTVLGPGHAIADGVACHKTATIEAGAIVKAPAIIGPGCFVAASAYLRGGVWLDQNCIIGPGAELKSSFMFAGGKLAHFNFVGDSILGEGVNLEAGSIVANYRNEREDKEIRVRREGRVTGTGSTKFGALIGDQARIGANAVLAPGCLVAPGRVVPRLTLLDQEATL